MVIFLEWGADCLRMIQLMLLPYQNPIMSCLIKIPTGLPFWYRLTPLVLEKRPLNRFTSSSNIYFQLWTADCYGFSFGVCIVNRVRVECNVKFGIGCRYWVGYQCLAQQHIGNALICHALCVCHGTVLHTYVHFAGWCHSLSEVQFLLLSHC